MLFRSKADVFRMLEKEGLAKLRWVEKTGCEGLSDFLYNYVNEIFLPDYGAAEAERLWCTKVEVRETDNNMAYRSGDRPGRIHPVTHFKDVVVHTKD